MFCKSLSLLRAGFFLACLAGPAVADSILLGGVEDYAGGSVLEGNGDYNDLMFQLTGNISVLAPGAEFYPLNPALVDESGKIFWDQHSYDGASYNFGYCAYGLGNCQSGVASEPIDYLAGPAGAAPLSELFQASGTITATLLYEKTSNQNMNTLGWYDPAHPDVLHQIFAGLDSEGLSVTFTPSEIFALYSANGHGQVYSSVAGDNQQEMLNRQHFALLANPASPSPTPEPATGLLAAIVLVVAAGGKGIYAMLRTRCG